MQDRTHILESLRDVPTQIEHAARRVQELASARLTPALLVLDDDASMSDWWPAYSSAVKLLEEQQRELERLHEQVVEMRRAITRAAQEREEKLRYTDSWWQYIEADLHASAGARWLEYFARALVDWRLDACTWLLELGSASCTRPLPWDLFRQGIRALQSGDQRGALPMLSLLTDAGLEGLEPGHRDELLAEIHVLIGRLHALLRDRERGQSHFERAIRLAPEDGRTHAGLGMFLLGNRDPTAVAHLRRAIELAPERPDGYVGMGLLAHDHERWSEANAWFDRAAEKVLGDRDPVQSVKRLLTPHNGNLLWRVARQLQPTSPERALVAIDDALALGIKGEGQYPQAPVHRLRGELLEAQGQAQQAAAAYHEAGKYFEWSNDDESALGLYRKVRNLDPSHGENYWHLSLALYRKAFIPQYPYANMAGFQESLDCWKEGARRQDPAELVWPLGVRAVISERQAFLGSQDERNLRFWHALTFIERAVLLQPSQADWYSHLTRLYRMLDLPSTAMASASAGLAIKPDDLNLLREKSAALANWGDYEGALETLHRALGLGDTDPWTFGILAFTHMAMKAYQDGLNAINQAISRAQSLRPDGPIAIWDLEVRASCQLMLGQRDAASRDYREIWRQFDPKDADARLSFINAAYQLAAADPEEGFLARAEALAERAIAEYRGRSGPSMEYSVLGLIRLEQNRVDDARQALAASLAMATRRHELSEHIHVDYPIARERAATWPHRAAALAVLDELTERCKARMHEVRLEPWAGELAAVLPSDPEASQTAMCTWVAVQAALARHDMEREDWPGAAHRYSDLARRSERGLAATMDLFPQHRVGLRNALERLQVRGKASLAAGRFRDAAADLGQALAFAPPGSELAPAVEMQALCGSAAVGLGDMDSARRHFVTTLESRATISDGDSPGELVARVCSQVMPSGAHFWALHDALQSLAESAGEAAALRRELDAARHALDLSPLFRLSDAGAEDLSRLPAVTPIAVEMGKNLIAGNDSDQSRLFTEYLPAMRELVHARMGVTLPGVRIRGNETDLPADLYIIMLDEVPIVSGSVQVGKRFAPVDATALKAAGVPEDVVEESSLPEGRGPGCWVAPPGWETVTNKGVELWPEPILYMVRHLESVLCDNLDMFVGMQEVKGLVEEWSRAGGEGLGLLRADDIYRLSRLLRELVRESVPIARWQDIVDELRRLGDTKAGGDPNGALTSALVAHPRDELVQAVRLRLRADLPGNRVGDDRTWLPEAIEAQIAPFVHELGDQRCLAMPPEPAQAVLHDIRDLVSENPATTLVTSDPRLRPLIRRLVAIEWPRIMVLSSDELVSSEGRDDA